MAKLQGRFWGAAGKQEASSKSQKDPTISPVCLWALTLSVCRAGGDRAPFLRADAVTQGVYLPPAMLKGMMNLLLFCFFPIAAPFGTGSCTDTTLTS